jgi:hypothetical protein
MPSRTSRPLSTASIGGRRVVASLLCVLALVVNLLGSVAYAESIRGAVSGGLGFLDASICHSSSESPAEPSAEPGLKCPLCQVAAAAFHAPAKVPVVIVLGLSVSTPVLTAMADAPNPPHPLAARPDPRGPPSLV